MIGELAGGLRTAADPMAALQPGGGRDEPFDAVLLPAGRVTWFSNPALAEQMLGDPGRFAAGEGNRRTMPLLARRSVFLTDRPENERRRAWMGPVLDAHAARAAQRLAVNLEADIGRWPDRHPFPLLPRLRRLLLRTMLPVVVSATDPARRVALEQATSRMLGILPALGAFAPPPSRESRWPPARLLAARRAALARLLAEEIRVRRGSVADAGDILSGLLDTWPRADEEVLVDELLSLVVAAREPLAMALAWAFERLVRAPAWYRRLAYGEDPALHATVAESLRLRPPIIGAFRVVTEPTRLGSRRLPVGATVAAAIPLVHLDPAAHPLPEQFRPERFLGSQPSAPTWISFGGGARRCLGAHLATEAMRAAIGSVTRSVLLTPAIDGPEPARALATALVPTRGCLVRRSSPDAR